MHLFIASPLIFFSAWTVSAQLCILLGWNLKLLLTIAPVSIVLLFYLYFLTSKKPCRNWRQSTPVFLFWRDQEQVTTLCLLILLVSPIALYFSYNLFFILSLFLLGICLIPQTIKQVPDPIEAHSVSKKLTTVLLIFAIVSIIILTYTVSRSDLDDAFYVAVAAFTSARPEQPLLHTDPMFGEIGLPLLFPSYRFASFELLVGAIAYELSLPAMEIYYIVLLPVWVMITIIATMLLTKEFMPKYWLWSGLMMLLLTVLLGETHRGPGNLSFVRLFQGKIVFLSTMVPTVFYITARFFSRRGSQRDLLLLACCQISSIGLTNFGMLAGPMAGFSALVSNIPLIFNGREPVKKFYAATAILLIPLPYLIYVSRHATKSPLLNFNSESAVQVFQSVLGPHQQYLIILLLLAGPILAKDTITRWRLAVPPLLLFGIYLNPWLAELISKHITTPPVYWRVVWSFPILIYSAIAFCMIFTTRLESTANRLLHGLLAAVVLGLMIYTLPLHTLRLDNIGPIEGFATWKIPKNHLQIAEKAVKLSHHGKLLAPDEIAGVIARFEQHPPLVNVREAYLELLRPAMKEDNYKSRRLLYDFITTSLKEDRQVRIALKKLDVSIIVMKISNESSEKIDLLLTEHYERQAPIADYSIWRK